LKSQDLISATKFENTCGRLPQEEHITIDSVIWQVLAIPKGFYKLMNAYLDVREHVMIVRVSVIGDVLDIATDAIFCQFWFDELPETQPIVVRATQFVMMWPRGKLRCVLKLLGKTFFGNKTFHLSFHENTT
jgi:hypothetical protein